MEPVIGIRREDKNEWERRVPLTPGQVRALVSQGIRVIVQPSDIRVFGDQEYLDAGAVVQEDLGGCNVVFGVKEFPASIFRREQAYMFFSHTIKGQEYNMPMLRALLDNGCTLIDYERVVDDKNRRLLFFGNYAGLAGMMETLYAYGRRLEWEGITTQFLALKRPLEYGSLAEAKAALEVVGKWIEADGLPPEICPLVVGFAGYGNVSRGAQEILDMLPTQEIAPGELADFIAKGEYSRHVIYKVVFYEKDMVVPIDPQGQFELQDYFQHPEKYRGVFQQYLDNLSMLVNCIYWTPDYPRLVTKDWVREHWTMESRLKVIGDISCDIEGSIECTLKATEPGNPSYVYLAETDSMVYGVEGNGPVIMSVDTLPSELPRESSEFFGRQLLSFVPAIARADYSADFAGLDLPPEIKRAVIVHRGRLTGDYEYLARYL